MDPERGTDDVGGGETAHEGQTTELPDQALEARSQAHQVEADVAVPHPGRIEEIPAPRARRPRLLQRRPRAAATGHRRVDEDRVAPARVRDHVLVGPDDRAASVLRDDRLQGNRTTIGLRNLD